MTPVARIALYELGKVTERIERLEAERDSLINVARSHGASWRAIGARTNVSHTTLYRRDK